jgi:hypothetical protein
LLLVAPVVEVAFTTEGPAITEAAEAAEVVEAAGVAASAGAPEAAAANAASHDLATTAARRSVDAGLLIGASIAGGA